MEKVLNIDGKNIPFKATGGTCRMYRSYFKRDLLKDFAKLEKKANELENSELETKFEVIDLEIFENLVWTMAKAADPDIPCLEEWLDGFETFSIYKNLKSILEILVGSMETTIESKNQLAAVATKKHRWKWKRK